MGYNAWLLAIQSGNVKHLSQKLTNGLSRTFL